MCQIQVTSSAEKQPPAQWTSAQIIDHPTRFVLNCSTEKHNFKMTLRNWNIEGTGPRVPTILSLVPQSVMKAIMKQKIMERFTKVIYF